MSQAYFQFKQFTVWHDRCAQRVGTDGVLLGAWCQLLPKHRRILDVGAGSGLISLMAAQRQPEAFVVGVEVDHASAKQACENVLQSPFASRVQIVEENIRHFADTSGPFDYILCNPPFHTEETLPPDESRRIARNAVSLSFESLIRIVVRLLVDEGLFSVVVPTWSADNFISTCLVYNLHLTKRCDVFTVVNKRPKRSLLTFSKSDDESLSNEVLVLQDETGRRSQDYLRLTADFYLDV